MAPFTAFLSLALSAQILLTFGHVIRCDTSNITLPALPPPLTLPPKTSKLSYVAIGVGTQNYTCGSTGTYTNVGALAELFDISCLASTNAALFNTIPKIAIAAWEAAPSNLTIAEVIKTLLMSKNPAIFAQHYFVPGPNGTGLDPKWDATSQADFAGNPNAFVLATKVNQTVAPTGNEDIDWISLEGIAGELAKEIYRTNTQLGQPPANCTSGSPEIEVKYAAMYYFFDSMLQH